jgi:hypothetical protein
MATRSGCVGGSRVNVITAERDDYNGDSTVVNQSPDRATGSTEDIQRMFETAGQVHTSRNHARAFSAFPRIYAVFWAR